MNKNKQNNKTINIKIYNKKKCTNKELLIC